MAELEALSEPGAALRPGEFSRLALATLDASEGRRRRRHRDTTPDSIGLEMKRDLLKRAAEADPEPDGFEGWLLEQAFAADASGPVRAMCIQILDEYRFACQDPHFGRWLRQGARSADTEEGGPDPLSQ